MAKLKVMNSQTGLTPAKADPTAMPVKPAYRVQHKEAWQNDNRESNRDSQSISWQSPNQQRAYLEGFSDGRSISFC
jgi:hypothetical protein